MQSGHQWGQSLTTWTAVVSLLSLMIVICQEEKCILCIINFIHNSSNIRAHTHIHRFTDKSGKI